MSELVLRDLLSFEYISNRLSSINSLPISNPQKYLNIRGKTYELRIVSFFVRDKHITFEKYILDNKLSEEKFKQSTDIKALPDIWYYDINTENVYILISIRR